MSGAHTGLSHDLPLAKAKVFKEAGWWRWQHACSYRPANTPYDSYPCTSHATALREALRHLERCA